MFLLYFQCLFFVYLSITRTKMRGFLLFFFSFLFMMFKCDFGDRCVFGSASASGFFACVLAACLLCPWNFLFGAFTAVWIGVAVGSILEEAGCLRIGRMWRDEKNDIFGVEKEDRRNQTKNYTIGAVFKTLVGCLI